MKFTSLAVCFIAILFAASANAADRVIIGNVPRTVEQLPNYAATDKGFFMQEGIQGDVVLIGSTDTLIQALIAGQVNVAIVDPSAAICHARGSWDFAKSRAYRIISPTCNFIA